MRINEQEAALQADFNRLNEMKRNRSNRQFNALKLQLRISLLIKILLLAATVGLRAFIYATTRKAQARHGARTGR